MIGVVGGGQLAQMLVEAGKKWNVKVAIQTGSRADPAASQSKRLVLFYNLDTSDTHLNSFPHQSFIQKM